MSTATQARTRSLAPSDLAQVAVFAALIAALALAPAIPAGVIGVPITLQTLGIALTGLCLGPLRGFAATALYVVAGLAGLPIFAKGAAGLAVLAGPTGGYVIAFPFAALLTGLLARWIIRRGLSALTPFLLFGAVAVSRLLVIWPLGAAGMARSLGWTYPQALLADMAYWLGDGIKAAVAAVLAFAVHKAFPRLLGR